jgi:hypothetical protein
LDPQQTDWRGVAQNIRKHDGFLWTRQWTCGFFISSFFYFKYSMELVTEGILRILAD